MAGIPHDLIGERPLWPNRFHTAREQIRARLVFAPSPILAQSFEQLRRQRQIAVARALPLMHMDQHERRIDVAYLQPRRFGAPQSGRIEQHQHRAVPQVQGSFDEPDDFFLAQDDRELLGRLTSGRSSRSMSRRRKVFLYRKRSAPMRSATVPSASFFS